MAFILSSFFFIFACIFVFYLPGRWVLRRIGYESGQALSNMTLAVGVGIALFLLCVYVLSWIHAPYVYLFALVLFAVLEFRVLVKNRTRVPWSSFLSVDMLIVLCGSLVMLAITFSSGLGKNGSIHFYGYGSADGIYHSALIGNMAFQFPPSFPGLSHTLLQGYHIFYDFMVAQFAIFFGFNTFDLYFRFFSLFTALFYGCAGIVLAYSLKMKTLTRRIFLLLLFFAQGFEFFLFHFIPNGALYDSGIVQPVGNIVDPSVLFSMAFVFLLFSTFFSVKKNMHYLLPILFLGILPGIKVYTGILTYAAIGILVGLYFLRKKFAYLFVLISAALISAVAYLPFNLGAGGLIFHPFLFFEHFMQSDRVLAAFQWALKLQVYELHHSIPRIIYLYTIALLYYFIPPLGIRLLTFSQITRLFAKKFYTPEHLFWGAFILIGLLLPMLFIQSVSVFNIIQFYWLIWIALLIPTAFSLSRLLAKPTRLQVSMLFLLLIVFALPVFSNINLGTSSSNELVVSKDLVAATRYIQYIIPRTDDILVVNRQQSRDLYSVPLFAALSRRPMYYEPEAADFSKTPAIEKVRVPVVDEVSTELATCPQDTNTSLVKTLTVIHVRYIVLMKDNSCIHGLSALRNVFHQGMYSIYKVQNL